MKSYIRRTMDLLGGLGFQVDAEDRKLRTDRWIFTHANAPDERLTLNFDSSETRCRVIEQRAKVIVGLAVSESGKTSPKARLNEQRRREREAERAARSAARAAAGARDAERRAERLVGAVAAQRRELDRLLRGGSTTTGSVRIPDDAMLTVEQVADMTGLSDKAVQRGIESERLCAVMTRDGIRVSGKAVKKWVAA